MCFPPPLPLLLQRLLTSLPPVFDSGAIVRFHNFKRLAIHQHQLTDTSFRGSFEGFYPFFFLLCDVAEHCYANFATLLFQPLGITFSFLNTWCSIRMMMISIKTQKLTPIQIARESKIMTKGGFFSLLRKFLPLLTDGYNAQKSNNEKTALRNLLPRGGRIHSRIARTNHTRHEYRTDFRVGITENIPILHQKFSFPALATQNTRMNARLELSSVWWFFSLSTVEASKNDIPSEHAPFVFDKRGMNAQRHHEGLQNENRAVLINLWA